MRTVWKIVSAPFRLVAWLGRGFLNLVGKAIGVEFSRGEMDGAGYERYVAQYLYKNGYKKVTQTGKTGDMGVDLVAQKHGVSYAVQCKYYSKPVSGAAVQEAVAGMAMYGCQRAMVVTNSHLTRNARALAYANHVTVLEDVIPDHKTLADVLTPGRIVSLAVGVVLFVLLWPRFQRPNATSWGVYLAAALGCYLVPRVLLGVAGVIWRWRRERRKQP